MSRRQVADEIRSMLASLEEDFPSSVTANETEGVVDPDQKGIESIDTEMDKPDETAVDSVDTTSPDAGTTGDALTASFDNEVASVEAMIAAAEKCEDDDDEDEDDEESVKAMIASLEAVLEPKKNARTAALTDKLDKLATALQDMGRKDLAERVDVVSNFLEAHAAEIE